MENCQPSENCTQRQTLKCSKPPIETNKKTSDHELELLEKDKEICEETDKADVLNLCHGQSELNVSINGTNLTTTDTSLNAVIGNFSNFLERQNKPLSSRVAVISISLGKPLFVVLGRRPYVTAAISFSKCIILRMYNSLLRCVHTAEGISNPNAYKLVCLNSTGQEALHLSANHNSYYVAIDSHNKVQALSESEIASVSL